MFITILWHCTGDILIGPPRHRRLVFCGAPGTFAFASSLQIEGALARSRVRGVERYTAVLYYNNAILGARVGESGVASRLN